MIAEGANIFLFFLFCSFVPKETVTWNANVDGSHENKLLEMLKSLHDDQIARNAKMPLCVTSSSNQKGHSGQMVRHHSIQFLKITFYCGKGHLIS